MCIALVLLFALLVPLDVFVADQAPDAGSAILMLYHFVFGSLLGLVFFALPFCYFFTQPHDGRSCIFLTYCRSKWKSSPKKW